MGLLEDILAGAKNVANAAGEKAGEIYEVSKLKLQAVQLNSDIAKAYELLGRLQYDHVKADVDNSDMMAHCVAEIEDLLWALNQIDEIICTETGTVKCHSCGVQVPTGSVYCSKCGMKVLQDDTIVAIATEPKKGIDTNE